MTHQHNLTRRTALTGLASTTLTAIAGCLNTTNPDQPADSTTTQRTDTGISAGMADGGLLVVNLADNLDADQLNLIQPDGELYGKRDIATGASQLTFELDTSYQPGDYTIIALHGDTTTAKTTLEIQPDLKIVDIGLYRNNPDKPWERIYGDSETDTKKNGEAYVTLKNTGSGPDEAIELLFLGDVPNPLENPHGNGMYKTERERIPAGDRTDLYSNSFPFGSTSEEGMGCSISGNSGEFTVKVKTSVGADTVSQKFAVTYSGSDGMSDCNVEISEI